MATNPNIYCGVKWKEILFTSLMRRINALETNPYIRKWGSPGTGNGEFTSVTKIFIYTNQAYVLDGAQNRIQIFDLDGTYLSQWSTSGTFSRGLFIYNDEVYLQASQSIKVFNLSGVLQRQWSLGGFGAALDVYVYNDEVYVTDAGLSDKVRVFNLSGVPLREWGGFGTGDGQFSDPDGIHIYNDEVYVVDRGNNRIQVFNLSGVFQRKWGSFGSGDGQFNVPRKVFVYDDEVYVSENGNNRIQVFNLSGVFQRQISSQGTKNGQLNSPVGGLHIFGDELYVSDTGNRRIQVFEITETQTTFYAYIQGARTSLGTPDGGVSIPEFNGLSSNKANPFISKHMLDMRLAIEAIVFKYTNADTGNDFNWTDLSADNLYFKALEDRTDYGATGGAAYDWTRSLSAGTTVWRDIDIGEIGECVTLLEAS